MSLFDKIHDSILRSDRDKPATIEEFVDYGLTPRDYLEYTKLQMALQVEIQSFDFWMNHPKFDELIAFCKEKKLVDYDERFRTDSYFLSVIGRDDASFRYGWLCYPVESDEFRLHVERKWSVTWDPEEDYLSDVFGYLHFDWDTVGKEPVNGQIFIDDNDRLRVKRYDPVTNTIKYLSRKEVLDYLIKAEREKNRIDRTVEEHTALIPKGENAEAVMEGKTWIREMYCLLDRQDTITEFYDNLLEASHTPDILTIGPDETLYAYLGNNPCEMQDHLVRDITAEFQFYRKPEKKYRIKRCWHCSRNMIPFSELSDMMDQYDIPKCEIIFPDGTSSSDSSDFDGFAPTSVFRDMGYTVSQTAGLTAAQRQAILEGAIKAGVASKYAVLNFLRQRIDINGAKSGNEQAVRKWEEDYEYIRGL